MNTLTHENLVAYLKESRYNVSDETAAKCAEFYPDWDGNGIQYEKDTIVCFNDILYKCLQSHTSQSGWSPTAAPSLWAKVLIPDPSVIPEWEQPESTNPYMKGDKVTHNGKTWESTIDNNVWEPGVVGTESLWKEVTE